jgi:threonine-phosphate decarboxylase
MTITHGGAIHAIAAARGVSHLEILDFSASINPLGPAPAVRDAIIEAIDRIVHYPDPYAKRLTNALAEQWDVEPDAILTGNGATDLLHFLARSGAVSQATLAVPTFSEFHRAWPEARYVPAAGEWPEDGFLAVTNPVNPTGELLEIPRRRGQTLVDESFLDFTRRRSCAHATFRLRSLTKFYAIPGLRAGALIGPPDLMRQLRLKREPWQVNVLAEAAVHASIRDEAHRQNTIAFVQTEGRRLTQRLGAIPGVEPRIPSANYVFAELHYTSRSLCSWLMERNILIRDCSGWPGIDGQAVRVAVRPREENDRLIECWKGFACES